LLFPILVGWGVCPRENVVSQSRGNFTIVPPKRERIFSKSRRLLPAISAIAFLRPGLDIIASRWPATSGNVASVAASQTVLARLRQTNINPIPENYFFSALSVFSFFAILCANPAANFVY